MLESLYMIVSNSLKGVIYNEVLFFDLMSILVGFFAWTTYTVGCHTYEDKIPTMLQSHHTCAHHQELMQDEARSLVHT